MGNKDIIKKRSSALLLFFIICALFVFSYFVYFLCTDVVGDEITNEDSVVMSFWTYEDDLGNNEKVEFEKKYSFGQNDSFTINSVIHKVPSDNSIICFLTMNDTEVYIDGKLRNDLVIDRDVHIIGGPVKNFYFVAPINRSDSGKTVSIVRHRGKGANNSIWAHEVMLGSASDIYRHLYNEYGPSFTLDSMILLASILIILAGFTLQLRLKQPVNMIHAGVAVFMTSAWILTDSYFFPFVFGHNYIDGPLSYFLCLLVPVPYIAYLSSLQKGRRASVFQISQLLILINFVVLTILHLTGILRFCDALVFIDSVLVLFTAVGVAVIILDFRQGHIRSYKYTAIGLLGFMAFAFAEIVIILTPDLVNTGGMTLFGLLFFLVFAVGQQFEDFREADLERRRAVELSDAKTNFLASMSHEIRTPINSILGMNEMILRENADPRIDSYARTVKTSGKMLLSLVNDILDFSKIEAGKLEVTNADYDLAALLCDISSIMGERAGQKDLKYDLQISDDIPSVLYCDEFRIKQILLNLLSNAVKYTDSGSVTLKVGGRYSSDEVFELRFDVEDTGRGIRKEDFDHLFDAFSRIDIKTNRNIEGTGLGLAIVKSIVDSLNGQISVVSEYQKGSTFTVTIPQKAVDRSPINKAMPVADRKEEKHECDYRAPEANVLAVDDNVPNLSIVREFLRDTEVNLDTCTNGLDALEKCKEKKYDLILLDHMMPEPDGIITLKIIRKNPLSLNVDTKAIVLTANAVTGSRQMYIDAGFIDYLTKPVDATILEATVKKHLPGDKIIPIINKYEETVQKNSTDSGYEEFDDGRMEFSAIGSDEGIAVKKSSRLDQLTEIDYETAMKHCAGRDDILVKVVNDIVKDSSERIDLLRGAVADKDYDAYRIGVHSIKGTMATIGANDISTKAKQHEFAVKEENFDFVDANYESFLNEYEELCRKLGDAIKSDS